jgi:hypothetical protein
LYLDILYEQFIDLCLLRCCGWNSTSWKCSTGSIWNVLPPSLACERFVLEKWVSYRICYNILNRYWPDSLKSWNAQRKRNVFTKYVTWMQNYSRVYSYVCMFRVRNYWTDLG